MRHAGLAGESGHSSDRNVVVGVKSDSQSKELLTWALLNVAQPGDAVVAVHVLDRNETMDRDGRSSILSLVQEFDSVLSVYEGFCNLKQVDLKFKICRGSSVRKILVREAEASSATHVIVGTAGRHYRIGSSASVAKYCAKSLSKDCWILAVSNGKVVFQRDGHPENFAGKQGIKIHQTNFLGSAYIKFGKNSKVTSSDVAAQSPKKSLAEIFLDSTETTVKQECPFCDLKDELAKNSRAQSTKDGSSDNDDEENPSAIVAASNSASMSIVRLPEMKPGWSFLRRKLSPRQPRTSDKSHLPHRQISVVQRAIQFPCRNIPMTKDYERQSGSNCESSAMVLMDAWRGTDRPPAQPCSRKVPKELEGLHEKYSSTCRLFSHQDLVLATSNFLEENLIGKGGSSLVYRGCLSDGKDLAVKILKPNSGDVTKGFLLEIDIITTLNHKNIISLVGFCVEDGHLSFVYDLLSRGSLEENLHGPKRDPLEFGWSERYRVAMGIADALDYLHRKGQPVIHRDVKSSNVLLSDDFEPQLSDFGLATWAAPTSSHRTCSDVAGTFGYLAPEYFMYGKVDDKIDVYAFGVVLLELLSGRKPISRDYPKGQESLVMWAKPILDSGELSQLLDPSLGDKYDEDQMEKMVLAATLCTRQAPGSRPQMRLVLKILQGDADALNWARLEVDVSETPDSLDDETTPCSNLQSYLNLALLDVEDDSSSIMSCIEQNATLGDYLSGRCSRSSSSD